MRLALVTGLAGETLTAEEREFLASARPAGLILFQRNCTSPDQIRGLVGDAVAAIGSDDVLVLIDQEGGRVQRLKPPHWRALPPAAAFGQLAAVDLERARNLAFMVARLTAEDLRGVGINTNCAPVLDVTIPGAHEIIGNRAYGSGPDAIVVLAGAVADGLMAGGVVPVIKHIPGHGRAMADSHHELPFVDAAREALEALDFAPFKALARLPAAMTAHVVYSAIDASLPASVSAAVTREVIRGSIGFDGLLMSDDLGMDALSGGYRERAAAVVGAGSDLALHCSGVLKDAREAASGVPALAGAALARFERAIVVTHGASPFDRTEAEDALAEMIGVVA